MNEFTAYFAIWWVIGTLLYIMTDLIEKHDDGALWIVVAQLCGPLYVFPFLWAILDRKAKARRGE